MQHLTASEEEVLVQYLLDSADRGFPLTYREIAAVANDILKSRDGVLASPVGKHWAERFLQRHHEVLATHWSRPLDAKRGQSLNPVSDELRRRLTGV